MPVENVQHNATPMRRKTPDDYDGRQDNEPLRYL